MSSPDADLRIEHVRAGSIVLRLTDGPLRRAGPLDGHFQSSDSMALPLSGSIPGTASEVSDDVRCFADPMRVPHPDLPPVALVDLSNPRPFGAQQGLFEGCGRPGVECDGQNDTGFSCRLPWTESVRRVWCLFVDRRAMSVVSGLWRLRLIHSRATRCRSKANRARERAETPGGVRIDLPDESDHGIESSPCIVVRPVHGAGMCPSVSCRYQLLDPGAVITAEPVSEEVVPSKVHQQQATSNVEFGDQFLVFARYSEGRGAGSRRAPPEHPGPTTARKTAHAAPSRRTAQEPW